MVLGARADPARAPARSSTAPKGGRARTSEARVVADAVRDAAGFPIGGVPPVGHATPLRIFIDNDLLGYDVVWADEARLGATRWHP
ncbi:MAG: hypothetical protein F2812_00425 [Actinobacteria bacterium]|nr:hypothetical protein [Actinomycetota bacterium]MSW90037.1 hypothetical protein [Actinomycetota bacterium]MSY72175.1 hypothetical protein [Actinomycetota bacterium]